MIKRIVLLCAVLTFAIMPCAFADAGYPIYLTDSDFIDIQYSVNSTQVEIGGEISVEINITNLTNKDIVFQFIYFRGIYNMDVDISYDNEDPKENEKYILGGHETLTFNLTSAVTDKLWEVYEVDGKYFIDLYPIVGYHFADAIFDPAYRDFECEKTPIEITNLYDGSEYIEFEWLDDTQNFYYAIEYTKDLGSTKGERTYRYGYLEYEYKYTNISDVELLGLKPGEEYIDYDSEEIEDLVENIEDTITFIRSRVFMVDGKYYCFAERREYNVGYLEKPQINMQITRTSYDVDNNTQTFEFVVTCAEAETIENFCIVTSISRTVRGEEGYMWRGDLNMGEPLKIECEYEIDNGNNYCSSASLMAGYSMENILYLWDVRGSYVNEESVILEPVKLSTYSVRDYDFYLEQIQEMKEREQETSVPVETAETTPKPTPTVNITEEPIPESTTEVTVTKTKSPYIMALIVIGVLICGAVVVIVLSMKKIVKNRQDEDRDD